MFLLEEGGGLIFNSGWKYFKKGGSDKKVVEKNYRGGCETMIYAFLDKTLVIYYHHLYLLLLSE